MIYFDFSDIIILFDINYSVLNLENSIQSLLNKYIIILKVSENFNFKISNFNEIEDYVFWVCKSFFCEFKNTIIQIFTNV